MKTSRTHNQELLKLTRGLGAVSRTQAARALGVSVPTMTLVANNLLARGVLVEAGQAESQGGRPARLLKLNPDHLYVVGIECSLLRTEAVLVNLVGEVLSRHAAEPAGPPRHDTVIETIVRLVEAVLSDHPDARPKGIGVGISGLVDRASGVSVRFPHAESWEGIPVGELLSTRLGLPAVVENDVQATTLTHLRYGVGKPVDDFLYLHIGGGIRLGIVTAGRLYSGATGKAGELGHVVVVHDGPVCYCGNYGCLESLAGPVAVADQARQAISKGVDSSIPVHAEQTAGQIDRKSTRLNSSHIPLSRMPSSA